MANKSSPQWQPEPEPQNELERVLLKAAHDPGMEGPLMRLLWESPLFVFTPDRPGTRGELELKEGDKFSFVRVSDTKGRYVPVFTSESMALHVARTMEQPLPAIACMPGDAVFRMLDDGQTRVQVIGPKGACNEFDPKGVALLVNGDLRHYKGEGGGGQPEQMTLSPVPAEAMPSKLRDGIRVFCARRRVPIGVYVFHPMDEATGEVDKKDWRILIWLRRNDTDFYNDFTLMAERLVPASGSVNFAQVTPETPQLVAFLQGRLPLWPILKTGAELGQAQVVSNPADVPAGAGAAVKTTFRPLPEGVPPLAIPDFLHRLKHEAGFEEKMRAHYESMLAVPHTPATAGMHAAAQAAYRMLKHHQGAWKAMQALKEMESLLEQGTAEPESQHRMRALADEACDQLLDVVEPERTRLMSRITAIQEHIRSLPEE